MEFLKSDVFKRIVAAIVMVALPILNKQLGLEIPSEQVVAAILGVAGYIVQSGIKAAVVAKGEAQVDSASIIASGQALGQRLAAAAKVPNPDPTPSIRGPSSL